jgi:hypothetical protein
MTVFFYEKKQYSYSFRIKLIIVKQTLTELEQNADVLEALRSLQIQQQNENTSNTLFKIIFNINAIFRISLL